ncbi:colicin E5-related ribonuclease [Treponema sp.]|uniref:colicin E5-related ribonuclease n=1 Tax=Treponema sp. TaxID=166 RepID=UPI0025ED8179|nr:colicin E5-related ribonuclease [Treponema sp.]MCR5218999.1 hypothetical protein [Treponema sp.]
MDFSSGSGYISKIFSTRETSFYIPFEKGFFMVQNDKETLFTRNGEFVKRGDDYYLAYTNFKLATKVVSLLNKATGNSVIKYYVDDVYYVVQDDVTKKIIQVADMNKSNWK